MQELSPPINHSPEKYRDSEWPNWVSNVNVPLYQVLVDSPNKLEEWNQPGFNVYEKVSQIHRPTGLPIPIHSGAAAPRAPYLRHPWTDLVTLFLFNSAIKMLYIFWMNLFLSKINIFMVGFKMGANGRNWLHSLQIWVPAALSAQRIFQLCMICAQLSTSRRAQSGRKRAELCADVFA